MELKGKTVWFLGSSVTYGAASGGVSFADLMAERCEMQHLKEAVSGTVLADVEKDSYVARLKQINSTQKPDLFICQLSTNDANPERVTLQQTEDAVRFILEYVKTKFQCPIVFYTGTYFENERYVEMIEMLYRLQKEYSFYILDFYNDETMRNIDENLYREYMSDPVHPTLKGYSEWWTPKFIEFCEALPV